MQEVKLGMINELINAYCSEDWVFLLNERTTETSYKAKSVIFKEGEQVQNISLVKSGKVKIFCCHAKGTERIYRFATNGQIIGHRGLGGNFNFPIAALSLTDTTTTNIPLSLFNSILKANPLFCYHFMLFFAEELRESEKQIKNMLDMDLRQRVASALKINADAFGFDSKNKKKLAFTLSRKDISSLAATTYESVIRTLSDFQNEEIIELFNKEIIIVNLPKLLSVIGK